MTTANNRNLGPTIATLLALPALIGAAQANPAGPPAAAGLPGTIEVVNKSFRASCAEVDNIQLRLRAASDRQRIRRFEIVASPPVYIETVKNSDSIPDWSGPSCKIVQTDDEATANIGSQPDLPCSPDEQRGRRELWAKDGFPYRITAVGQPTFWRGCDVPLNIIEHDAAGQAITHTYLGYAYIQIVKSVSPQTDPDSEGQVIVFYPSDGSWRFSPLPPSHLRHVSMGSTVLLGPIEEKHVDRTGEFRLFVDISSVDFYPEELRFVLHFRQGGSTTVRVPLSENTICAPRSSCYRLSQSTDAKGASNSGEATLCTLPSGASHFPGNMAAYPEKDREPTIEKLLRDISRSSPKPPGADLVCIARQEPAISDKHLAVEVSFSDDFNAGVASDFAAVTSMYMTQENSDAQLIEYYDIRNQTWRARGFFSDLNSFDAFAASEVKVLRPWMSYHNVTAPDVDLKGFVVREATPSPLADAAQQPR